MNRSVLVLGATSTIAEHLCRRLAASGARLHLLARSRERLEAVAADLRLRGASDVATTVLDFLDSAALVEAIDAAFRSTPAGFDCCVIAHGSMPEEAACVGHPDETARVLRENAESAILAGGRCALHLERQRSGVLVFLGSVAADRGRAYNATYGAAKAAVVAFASGLGQRLARSGVRVLTVKLGPVRSAMTAHLAAGALWIEPERAADSILRRLAAGSGTVYCPAWWRPIMFVIRNLPQSIFDRLRF